MYGVAIVGSNFGILTHLPGFEEHRDCHVCAIYSRDLEKAKEICEEHKIELAYDDYDKLLANPQIHIVALSLPPLIQVEFLEKAFRAGKHVFLEKPLLASDEKIDELLNLAKSKNLKHTINFEFYKVPLFEAFKDLLDEYKPIAINHVRVNWHSQTGSNLNQNNNWKVDNNYGGGVMNNIACHSLFYMEWLFGKITKVWAKKYKERGQDLGENFITLECETEKGIPLSCQFSDNTYGKYEHVIEVQFQNRYIKLFNYEKDYLKNFEIFQIDNFKETHSVQDEFFGEEDGRVYPTMCMVNLLIEAINNNTESEVNIVHAKRVNQLMSTIEISHQSGTWQTS